jgi:splicing factor 3A subunit 1
MANITIEDQINAIHRSQGLLDDDSAANRIGPSVPKPTTSTYSSTAKTIQKPPQLSGLVAKPMVSMAAPTQRTIIATPIRPGMQPMAILPQATHAMVAMPSMVAVASQQPLHPPPMIDEPSAKRSKTEDQLIPEEEFYKTFGRGQVTITVQLPIVPEKPEWNLNGQAIPLTLPITDPISVIKAKLSDLLGGMPAGKQKLVYNEMFVKDSNSLGYYNMMKGSVVYLQLKERGGRKK